MSQVPAAELEVTTRTILRFVTDILKLKEGEATLQTNFEDQGADSLDGVEIIMWAEDEFDIVIEDDRAEQIKTVQDLLNVVMDLRAAH